MRNPATPSKSYLKPSWAVIRAALMVLAVGVATPVLAQSWWPFGDDEPRRPPVPREPVYRPDPQESPPPAQAPLPGQQPAPSNGYPPPQQPGQSAGQPSSQAPTNWATKNPICYQLEQRLVQEGQRGSPRDQLPQLDAQIRDVGRTYQQAQSKLDRSCYEYFLFTKTFRNTPDCKNLAVQFDATKRKLTELEAQRQQIASSGGRSYKDDIINELARNNCGANYAEQARRRGGRDGDDVWQDEESVGTGNTWTPYGNGSVSTYRTLCVRLCDGYYFPVSFSTLPSHFEQDANVCTSKCAAPVELYYYQNPGGAVDQMVDARTQEPYTKLKSAFRYRKEYVNGCSCKEAEYISEDQLKANKKAEASGAQQQTEPVVGQSITVKPRQSAISDGWRSGER